MYKFVLLLGLICTGLGATAQTGISIETFPMRYVYGFNGQINYETKGRHLISLFYQNHTHDFFSLPDMEVSGNTWPVYADAQGHTYFVSFQFPLDDAGNGRFWYGPKVGRKEVFGTTTTTNFQGTERDVLIDQTNNYILGQFTFRYHIQSFFIGGYLHAGLVNIRWEDTRINPDGSIHYVGNGWDHLWLPHGLLGVSLGVNL